MVARVRVAAVSASIAGVLTASLSLVGCGGDNRDDTSPPTVGRGRAVTSASARPPSPRAQAKTTPSPAARRGSVVIDWLKKYTPAGGGHGEVTSTYAAFMQGDCEDTLARARVTRRQEMQGPLDEPYRGLYEGVAAACLAAFHGRQSLWRTAEARFSSTRAGGLDCWHLAVYAIFEKLVRAYRADPGARFVRGRASGSSKCPELTGVDPDHGPPEGGYTVVVSGRGLPPTLKLSWNWDLEVTARKDANGVMTLKVPPIGSGQDAEVVITIADAPAIEAVSADFTYECAYASC